MANNQRVNLDLPPRPADFEYMCVAFYGGDTLHVISGSEKEAATIRKVIQETWPNGIQKETFKLNGVYEFKLKGNPFNTATSSSDALACRRMAERILHVLYRDGWKLHISCNINQANELATWIFKKVPPVVDFSPQPFLVVGLSDFDSLMILNAPTELHQVFKDAIEKSWPNGIQKWTYKNDVLRIKLKGFPWFSDGEDAVHSKVMLQTVISDLIPKQWNLYGNSNIRSESNTFFFDYHPNLLPDGQSPPAQFTISFNCSDLLRVIGAPDDFVSVVRNTIRNVWPKGIEEESRYAESWQFKLRGNPWSASGNKAVKSKLLVIKLMEALLPFGWSPVAAIDSTKKMSNKSSLLFRQSQPKQASFFCLSVNGDNNLWLINTSDEIMKLCKEVIQSQYALGTRWVQQHVDNMELSLMGKPWTLGDEGRHDGIHARSMLCHLISALTSRGWKAVISADVSDRYSGDKSPDPVDVDSIYFMYDPAAPLSVPPSEMQYPPPYLQPLTPPYPHQPPPYGIPQQDVPPPSFDPPSYESLS